MQCPSCGNPHFYEGLEGPDCPDVDCSHPGQKKKNLSLNNDEDLRQEEEQREDQTTCMYCGCVPCIDSCPSLDFDNLVEPLKADDQTSIFVTFSGSSNAIYNIDWDLLMNPHSDLVISPLKIEEVGSSDSKKQLKFTYPSKKDLKYNNVENSNPKKRPNYVLFAPSKKMIYIDILQHSENN